MYPLRICAQKNTNDDHPLKYFSASDFGEFPSSIHYFPDSLFLALKVDATGKLSYLRDL